MRILKSIYIFGLILGIFLTFFSKLTPIIIIGVIFMILSLLGLIFFKGD